MGMRISTNVSSINAQRALAAGQREISKSYSQLSSGSRITRAADDSAGLAISENLKSTIRSSTQAQRNANDGISIVQTAEGGLNEISNILIRMRELGVQAASDTIGDTERGFVNKEIQQLKNESERIAQTTRFGKTDLLNGKGGRLDFQIDINNDDFQDRIGFDSNEIRATNEDLEISDLDFSDKFNARKALETLQNSQNLINGYRSNLGALQNRLVSTTDNLSIQVENNSAANSRIRDTDIAQSSAELQRNNIMMNAATGIVAQANAQPQLALKLIN